MKVLTIDALYGLGATDPLAGEKGAAYDAFQAQIEPYYALIDATLEASRAGAITPAESERLQAVMDAAIQAAENHNSGQLLDKITTSEAWAAWKTTRDQLLRSLESAKTQVEAGLRAAGVSVGTRTSKTFWIALGTAVVAGGLAYWFLRSK